jgi:hypothetical protein
MGKYEVMLWVQGYVCRVAFLPASKPLMVVGKNRKDNRSTRNVEARMVLIA